MARLGQEGCSLQHGCSTARLGPPPALLTSLLFRFTVDPATQGETGVKIWGRSHTQTHLLVVRGLDLPPRLSATDLQTLPPRGTRLGETRRGQGQRALPASPCGRPANGQPVCDLITPARRGKPGQASRPSGRRRGPRTVKTARTYGYRRRGRHMPPERLGCDLYLPRSGGAPGAPARKPGLGPVWSCTVLSKLQRLPLSSSRIRRACRGRADAVPSVAAAEKRNQGNPAAGRNTPTRARPVIHRAPSSPLTNDRQ